MRVVLVNRSDGTGGAAVVSTRLLHALRDAGVDAQMLVIEKLSDSPYVHKVGDRSDSASVHKAPESADSARGRAAGGKSGGILRDGIRAAVPFLAERLQIFLANGFDRKDLFKADTASFGLPLADHPLVKSADAVLLNWVNQGMLSLREIGRIAARGTKILWTMHDMWCATGICHHAGECTRFREACGNCPLLHRCASTRDLSRKVHDRKRRLYSKAGIHFVAVSRWLAGKCRESSLLRDARVSVIPNAVPQHILDRKPSAAPRRPGDIIFAAARVDDPIKGLPILIRATEILAAEHPEESRGLKLHFAGTVADPSLLQKTAIPWEHHGRLSMEPLLDLYAAGGMVVSSSLYETLPGTLVEGQALGCVPVAFDSGGQGDIVEHMCTGYLAELHPADTETSARNLAAGILWASRAPQEVRDAAARSVRENFSAGAVARSYLALLSE